MKNVFVIFILFVFSSCGQEPAVVQNDCQDVRFAYATPSPVVIRAYLDPDWPQGHNRIITALNTYWSKVSVSVIPSNIETADIGVAVVQGVCKTPIMVGHLPIYPWNKMDTIIMDLGCSKLADWLDRLSSLLSNALGNAMGIEEYPGFCSNGIMSSNVSRIKGDISRDLSAEDMIAFRQRKKFASSWEYKWKCAEKKEWERGTYNTSEMKEVKFQISSNFVMPIGEWLNSYFEVFGRKFVESENADFSITTMSGDGCSPAAIAYPELHRVDIKEGCLSGEKEHDASLLAHEVAHLFGVGHIPEYCGNALMDPELNPGPFFTDKDIMAWQERDVEFL